MDNKVKGNSALFGICILLLLVGLIPMGEEYFMIGSVTATNSVTCPDNTYCELPAYTNGITVLNYSDVNVPVVVRYE